MWPYIGAAAVWTAVGGIAWWIASEWAERFGRMYAKLLWKWVRCEW